MRTAALFSVLAVAGTLPVLAQEPGKPAADQTSNAQKSGKEAGVTYGRIKEVKAGQKIVIAIDGAPDKSYSLADAKRTVSVAEDLAIGDPVKVVENKKKNANSVQIVRDVRPEAQHGDQHRSRSTSGAQK